MAERFVYDPLRADFQANAYQIYRRLRDQHPVYHDEVHDIWALSRFDDVLAAASDAATFSSEKTGMSEGFLPMVQTVDPPRHDELRSLVSLAFTPKRIAGLEARIRAITEELLDDMACEKRVDLFRRFALQLPNRVICELIGVPPEHRPVLLECIEPMVTITPATDTDSDEIRRPAMKAYEVFAELLEARREQPQDDLMSALLQAEIDGQRLSEEELLGFCFVLILAGTDTTTNLIANGSVLLARHRDERERLAGDSAMIPGAVEEMLRYESPVQALARRATRDVTLHGVTIPKGAHVRLVWGAANRDEREFEDPDRFDITRQIRRHLAFGHGVHFCLGSNLARLEARIAFERLLARLPGYELAGEPVFATSMWARAYETVPIAVGPAPGSRGAAASTSGSQGQSPEA